MLPTMQGLVEGVMYVSQGEIPISVGNDAYNWICARRLSLPHGMISHYEPHITRREASLKRYEPQGTEVDSSWRV